MIYAYYDIDGDGITEDQAYDEYNDYLDEMYPDQVGNILAHRILKEVDPIAYQVGFNDYENMRISNGDWDTEAPLNRDEDDYDDYDDYRDYPAAWLDQA